MCRQIPRKKSNRVYSLPPLLPPYWRRYPAHNRSDRGECDCHKRLVQDKMYNILYRSQRDVYNEKTILNTHHVA